MGGRGVGNMAGPTGQRTKAEWQTRTVHPTIRIIELKIVKENI